MIKVNSAIQQEKIIDLLNNFHDEEEIQYTFLKKEGISLLFETTEKDVDKAAKKAKEIIKKECWGSILYFQVVPA